MTNIISVLSVCSFDRCIERTSKDFLILFLFYPDCISLEVRGTRHYHQLHSSRDHFLCSRRLLFLRNRLSSC